MRRERFRGCLRRQVVAGSAILALLALTATSTAVAAPLSWPPPDLVKPTVVTVSASNRVLRLDPTRDYEIRLPATPLSVQGGLVIDGGRNVVMIGGEIAIPKTTSMNWKDRRGLYVIGQTGTLHIEGVRFTGDLSEGIDIQSPAAEIQLQNLAFEPVRARDEVRFTDTHPDLIQSWAGPIALRIDGLSGATDYQGFFLDPNQFFMQTSPKSMIFRRIDIRHTTGGRGYLLWLGRRCSSAALCQALQAPSVEIEDVWTAPSPGLPNLPFWQDPHTWNELSDPQPRTLAAAQTVWAPVSLGTPPGGSFVGTSDAGVGYQSPGYRGVSDAVSPPSCTCSSETITNPSPGTPTAPAAGSAEPAAATTTPTPTPTAGALAARPVTVTVGRSSSTGLVTMGVRCSGVRRSKLTVSLDPAPENAASGRALPALARPGRYGKATVVLRDGRATVRVRLSTTGRRALARSRRTAAGRRKGLAAVATISFANAQAESRSLVRIKR
jgi:hypothetical protein